MYVHLLLSLAKSVSSREFLEDCVRMRRSVEICLTKFGSNTKYKQL